MVSPVFHQTPAPPDHVSTCDKPGPGESFIRGFGWLEVSCGWRRKGDKYWWPDLWEELHASCSVRGAGSARHAEHLSILAVTHNPKIPTCLCLLRVGIKEPLCAARRDDFWALECKGCLLGWTGWWLKKSKMAWRGPISIVSERRNRGRVKTKMDVLLECH